VIRLGAKDGAVNLAALGALGILLAARTAFGTAAPVQNDQPVAQPTTAPAVARQVGVSKTEIESIELARRGGQQKPSPTSLGNQESGMLRVVGALGVVIGCILVVRWVGRRFLGMAAGGTSSGPVQVLSRTAIAPRQQLMLIQVGRRLVLVANCGTAMNALCEINDADEVAALAGELQQRKRGSATSNFLSFFGRAGAKFEAEQAAITAPVVEEDDEPQLAREPVQPELATTRQEMRGLLDRVHKLSRHYQRSSK
jgi:flagellar biogenesis protein FliO